MCVDLGDKALKSGITHLSQLTFLSVVVPCFDEESVLDELYARLTAVLHKITDSRYEIVLVNDGSRDATWESIRRLSLADSHLVGIDLSRNHGHQLAITAGLSVARGDLVLVLDADLQDPPELLIDMLRLMRETGADVVYGRRTRREGETWFKRTSAYWFYHILGRLSSTEIPADVGDFRLMTRRVVELLNSMAEHQRFLRGMVPWVGFRQVPIDYERQPRAAGTSKYPVHKMIRLALDALTSFSLVPLRVSSYLGFAVAFIAIILAIYTVVIASLGHAISGWASLMLVVLFLGGTQLIVVGLLGEYIGRIHEQTQNRPLFIVRDVVRNENPAQELS